VSELEEKGNAQAIIEAVQRLDDSKLIALSPEVAIADVPTKGGRELQSVKRFVDEYRTVPERKVGTAYMHEPESFVNHVNRMKDEHTALFATVDRTNPKVTAVYDYHQIDGSPRFGQHRAIYPFPLADEWKAWLARNGFKNVMDQRTFSEFLEDRAPDLCPANLAGKRTQEYVDALECAIATPGQIIALSRELSVRVEQTVVNNVRIGSGETQMQWKEEHKDLNGEALRIPGAFLIAIPIFSGGEANVLPVRLRYRVRDGGKVFWFYDLALVDLLFREAVNAELAKIHAGVELPIYIGSPEGTQQ
jgi:uncharacterized protein YfdQ (DUF2303 family)